MRGLSVLITLVSHAKIAELITETYYITLLFYITTLFKLIFVSYIKEKMQKHSFLVSNKNKQNMLSMINQKCYYSVHKDRLNSHGKWSNVCLQSKVMSLHLKAAVSAPRRYPHQLPNT